VIIVLSKLPELWRRLLFYWRREQFDRELQEEMNHHLEMKIRDAANRDFHSAQRQFGNQLLLQEVSRDMWAFRSLEHFAQDVRYGLRMLFANKGFTIVAVLTLALGIGANTAVFTLINALLLRSLPVPNPNELVVLSTHGAGGPGIISFPMYRDLRSHQTALTDIEASTGAGPVRLTIPGAIELDNIQTNSVTGNYWSVFGVQPAAGRFFGEDDDRNPNSSETAGSVAVLSYSLWERQFGRDPAVLGRTVLVDRSPCRVVGIAPRDFFGEQVGGETDVWVPLTPFSSIELLDNRHGQFTAHIGRLKPGIGRDQAQAAMSLLFQQLHEAERDPGVVARNAGARGFREYQLDLQPGGTGIGRGILRQTFRQPLWIVMAIVGLVLMIACANVANLLLARAVARQREISVRLALGCGRFRLMRQLLTESLLLSALGTAAGLLVAWWGSHVLLRMVDTQAVPLRLDLSPDRLVLGFTAAAMVLTGLGFGLVPAWRASRLDLAGTMKDQSRGTGIHVRQYLGRALVVFQVALSLLLLVGASLLIRSLHNLGRIPLGFRPEQVLLFQLAHNPSSSDAPALARVAREVEERIGQVPGVQSTSLSSLTLFSRSDISATLKIQGYAPAPDEHLTARFNAVSPDYFETVGMTLAAGRSLEEGDSVDAPQVAVINETMARLYFPGGDAVGRMIEIVERGRGKPIEVVGIVRDAKYNDLRTDAKAMFYMSLQQLPRRLNTLEVRTSESMGALSVPVRNALLDVTRDIMIRRVITLSTQVDQTLAAEHLLTTLCTFFGALALLLASVGLYGVLSYGVAKRTQEIGIRMALGASGRRVKWLVLRQSISAVALGIGLGLLLAVACGRLISKFLYGMSPNDPASTVVATMVLILVALVACYLPARRATKIDPIIALRNE
jgi:predicted permease